jgi:hypothetical protein
MTVSTHLIVNLVHHHIRLLGHVEHTIASQHLVDVPLRCLVQHVVVARCPLR